MSESTLYQREGENLNAIAIHTLRIRDLTNQLAYYSERAFINDDVEPVEQRLLDLGSEIMAGLALVRDWHAMHEDVA